MNKKYLVIISFLLSLSCTAQTMCDSGYVFFIWNKNFNAQYECIFIANSPVDKSITYTRSKLYKRPSLSNKLSALEESDDLKYFLQMNGGLLMELNQANVPACSNGPSDNHVRMDSMLRLVQDFFMDSVYKNLHSIDFKSFYERDTAQFLIAKVTMCYRKCQLKMDRLKKFNYVASPDTLTFLRLLDESELTFFLNRLKKGMVKTIYYNTIISKTVPGKN